MNLTSILTDSTESKCTPCPVCLSVCVARYAAWWHYNQKLTRAVVSEDIRRANDTLVSHFSRRINFQHRSKRAVNRTVQRSSRVHQEEQTHYRCCCGSAVNSNPASNHRPLAWRPGHTADSRRYKTNAIHSLNAANLCIDKDLTRSSLLPKLQVKGWHLGAIKWRH